MTAHNLPTLKETVLEALTFFEKNLPPRLKIKGFSFPLVVGSGNAFNTGQILFSGQPALIASESNFENVIKGARQLIKKKIVKEAIIISASGEKDSIWETKLAKTNRLKTILLTCTKNSSAAKFADKTIVYEKLPEPYTYNFSTYLGMILSGTNEEVKGIKSFIKNLQLTKDLKKYDAYSFILPDQFAAICPMLEIKRDELFGSFLSLRAFSFGAARHAKFVNLNKKELVISLGENNYFGEKNNRLEIKLPPRAGNSLVLALTYYLVGLIQEVKPPYFKKNIAKYCQTGPASYNKREPFPLIVK